MAKKIAKAKMAKVMGEFEKGVLHSGSKKGKLVESPKQAIAIGISEGKMAKSKIAKH